MSKLNVKKINSVLKELDGYWGDDEPMTAPVLKKALFRKLDLEETSGANQVWLDCVNQVLEASYPADEVPIQIAERFCKILNQVLLLKNQKVFQG